MLLLNWQFVTGQQIQPLMEIPKPAESATASFGVDKIANTYVFTGNADVRSVTDLVTFRWVNTYRSSAFRTLTMAIRDDEFSQISLAVPLSSFLSAVIRQDWVLSRDSRSVGLNSLERLGGVGGLRWSDESVGHLEAVGGLERTTQIGQRAVGFIGGIDGQLTDLALEEWRLNSRLIADYQRMDSMRANSDILAHAGVMRVFSDVSQMQVGLDYTNVHRDFFTALSGSTSNELAVEQRGEERVRLNSDVSYGITGGLSAGLVAGVDAARIGRGYRDPYADVSITKVDRTLSELTIDVALELRYAVPLFSTTLGIALYTRNEQNSVAPIAPIDEQDLAAIRSQENQRDNTSKRSKFYSSASWFPSERDTVRVEGSSWLLRYDTPSALNYDDRDELNGLLTIRYGRKISPLLSFNLTLSGQYVHMVFLNRQRSAINNENRVIRIAPQVIVNGSVVKMQPQIEVLANYTVYDFDEPGANARSYSFRQIAIRDSIRIRLTQELFIDARILFRYFERGALFWGAFAETPQNSNLEQLSKILLFYDVGSGVRIGTGVRLYQLEQRTLGPGSIVSGTTSSVQFWAPETAIQYTSANGSDLSLGGWYELQHVNVTGRRNLPNLLLQARVVF
ncbi:MAG: hypothetical protein JSS89_07410 [Bacteroidetes bacterium]|nr:hypothetical protein [Bacteroidota bacterium]